MDVPITVEGAEARRSRGTPRIANRLLRRVRDYASKGTGEVNHEMAQRALDMLSVDKAGLDTLDRRYLSMLLERFDGDLLVLKPLQLLWLKIAEHLKMLLNLI